MKMQQMKNDFFFLRLLLPFVLDISYFLKLHKRTAPGENRKRKEKQQEKLYIITVFKTKMLLFHAAAYGKCGQMLHFSLSLLYTYYNDDTMIRIVRILGRPSNKKHKAKKRVR